MTAAADIAAGLNGRRNGKGWLAKCPAHADKHPSLSIDEGRDGKALVVCRAGCSQEEVIDALRDRGLWPEPLDGRRQPTRPRAKDNSATPEASDGRRRPPQPCTVAPGRNQTPTTTPVTVEVIMPAPATPPDFKALLGKEPTDYWDYLDTDGKVLGYTVRTEGPDGKKDMRPVTWCNGAWKLKAFPEPRPLYGLCALAERPDAPVLIVEGEKTAVAAANLLDTYVVITWPGGCGAVSKADWSVLEGRDIVIWPDADEPGVKAASEVMARLPGARVVMLPEGLPKGWDLADDIPVDIDVEGLLAGAQVPVETSQRITLTYPSEWTDPPPPRKWLVENWIPWGTVTAMYGDGGMGKSLLCQQLLTCAASDNDWLGMRVTQVKSLAVFCEDPKEEHKRRQWDIHQLYGTGPADIKRMAFLHRFGCFDNALMTYPHRDSPGQVTDFYHQILKFAQEFGAKLVVLDSLHNLFTGDENVRPQALQFVQALAAIAIEINGAVIFTGHPSMAGLSSGKGTSGSTAWPNATRSFLYLSARDKDKSQGNGDDVDPKEKVLRVMKANYGPVGDGIRLTWGSGVLNHHPEEMGVDATAKAAKASRVFTTLLDEAINSGVNLSASDFARNYAPKYFARRPRKDRENLTAKDFDGAMRRALRKGDIKSIEYGPQSKLKHRLEITPNGGEK